MASNCVSCVVDTDVDDFGVDVDAVLCHTLQEQEASSEWEAKVVKKLYRAELDSVRVVS